MGDSPQGTFVLKFAPPFTALGTWKDALAPRGGRVVTASSASAYVGEPFCSKTSISSAQRKTVQGSKPTGPYPVFSPALA